MNCLGIDWTAVPLGTAPDATIAGRLGCDRETVRTWRVRMGIPAYRMAARHARDVVVAYMRRYPGRIWRRAELYAEVVPRMDIDGPLSELIAARAVERTSVGRYRLVRP